MPLSHLIALISNAHFGCQRSGVRCHVGTRSDHLVPDQKSIETNRYEVAVKLPKSLLTTHPRFTHAVRHVVFTIASEVNRWTGDVFGVYPLYDVYDSLVPDQKSIETNRY